MHEVKTELERVPEGVSLTVRKGGQFVRITMTRAEAGRMAAELALASFGESLHQPAPMQTGIRL